MNDVQVAVKTFPHRIMVFDIECAFLLTNLQKFIDYYRTFLFSFMIPCVKVWYCPHCSEN